jgi:endonuclease/exonuclease/phosphatase (EEP) superfamily protein YafD
MSSPETVNPNEADVRLVRRKKRRLSAAGFLCVVAATVYLWQPDWLAPVSLIPAWCWLVPAVLLFAMGVSRKLKFWSLAVLVLWGVFVGLFVEEATSLVRLALPPANDWQTARENGWAIRVVSLNCAAADQRAAAEIARYDPDIVLLQETPMGTHLDELSHEMYGEGGATLWGGDTSLLARGTIQPIRVDRESHFIHATVELNSGAKVEVVSLRLNPPVFRLDGWSPGFWRDHRDNRRKHRQELLEVVEGLGDNSLPLIVGGDFNMPPHDAALAPLHDRLEDTFRVAGQGWGNTGTNDFPLFRVDQIWASRECRPVRVLARKTIHSDHRMVICDLILK